ncbi:hypothetical protein [Micromonospora sp. C41]|uniref:hypothetical protein n=1 Tax=Micromonospora sp. C41 TaxID=2824878 RepID=UPI001B386938|nr:hypothetical protein [Micromonospora sp. C41]MBQ1060071.1 hypothetical protein [Micromonospora sp. C41]
MTITASAPVPESSRLTDADTADLAAIRRAGTNSGRFPTNQPYTGRAAGDLELVELARLRNPEAVHRLAEAIREREAGNRPPACPAWCSQDHRGQITEEDGFTIGLVHELNLAEITALDPQHFRPQPATVSVYIESSTEAGEPTDPARIVMTVAEGAEGQYHGSIDTGGWTGTPEEAEQLAHALLAAARILKADR